ncbi:MAG: hypothetical protein JST64_13415 [Actinobacteria bacterium]|nr:hypothetical protein [Actinomycetota bacterium]
MRIVAQRELAGGRQELVAIDSHVGVTDVLVRPTSEWTWQAPKTMPDGTLMAYRCRPGQQFNLNADAVELTLFDGPGFAPRIIPRPVRVEGLNRTVWTQHGHATPTDHETLIHAAKETTTWWWWPFPIRAEWACVETDLTGRPTGARWEQQAEPSWTGRGLTRISTAGTGAIVTPTRTFAKATSPVGAASFGWFDPHISPDGTHVVWLDIISILPVTSGLIVGNCADGTTLRLTEPTTDMQTDAMWMDDRTLCGSRYIDGHWRIVLIDVLDGAQAVVPNTEDCTAVHVAR